MYRQKMAALVIGAALLAAACGDDTASTTTTVEQTSTPTATEAPAATETPTTSRMSAMYPNGLRDVRYCEVLLLTKVDDEFIAHVWGSQGQNECPQADWEALDAAAIATERGALLALLNGPRHWTLDSITANIKTTGDISTFGNIEMMELATVNLGPGVPDQSPYHAKPVVRDTVFTFNAGTEIYLLADTDGVQYVMQSYAQIVDPTMSIDRLATLGTSLKLPTGWTYTTTTLTEQLDVYDTKGIAMVLQDDFKNSYQRIDTPGA
ncbi:MAG: hypothetical protein F2681_03195 [Actinobacteria bacterium]|nr:hypothetical protein [Actinomycetota bacterium]MSW76679.1 hypothetical protein [Actinomycetota bacterium]MSX54677.1 hypothetical protein [Actinomycetota bacterium]MSX92969.1 hypothetical protein [Actinomycetota bacterium]MSZ82126.1 hypothetical protein [Actinomycetota bacterium]